MDSVPACAGGGNRIKCIDKYVHTVYYYMQVVTVPKGELIVKGRFEWFKEKDEQNVINHGFSFEQILDIFNDVNFYEIYDSKHSKLNEDRYFGLGCTNKLFVVAVSYTEKDLIHIISARLASPKEKNIYDAYCREING